MGAEPLLKGAEPVVKGAELPPSFPPLLGQLAEAFEEHLPCKYPPGVANTPQLPPNYPYASLITHLHF